MTNPLKPLTCLLLVGGLLATGCLQRVDDTPVATETESDAGTELDHDADRYVPKSISAGIEEVTAYRNQIRDAFASGNPGAAHNPLHSLPDVLEGLRVLVEREITDAEQLETINASLETLFASFGAVDAKMHNREGADYSEVSDKIDAALTALKEATSAGPTDSQSSDDNATSSENEE